MAAGIDRYLKAAKKRAAVQQLKDGTQVIATSTVYGPTQMRCMHCHGMCKQTVNSAGQEVYRCDSCGAESAGRPL